jgi:hypothetical protein
MTRATTLRRRALHLAAAFAFFGVLAFATPMAVDQAYGSTTCACYASCFFGSCVCEGTTCDCSCTWYGTPSCSCSTTSSGGSTGGGGGCSSDGDETSIIEAC